MARIRSIHPSLFTDDAFMSLTVTSPMAVIALHGLWCEADDGGIFEWKPLTLKARILPAPMVDFEELLATLEAGNFIRSYEHEGRKYGAVRNFRRFQRPKKPNPIHFMPPEMENYVGLKQAEGGTASPPVPHRLPTGGEKSPQMEDGGGKKEGSEAKASAVPDDPQAKLFHIGVPWLVKQTGKPDGAVRAMIGKWRKDHSAPEVLSAVSRAQAENAIDPVAFITRVLSPKHAPPERSNEYRVGGL